MQNKLEEKVWYRFYKVFAVIVMILSFFGPLFIHFDIYGNILWIIPGIINVFIYAFVFWILRKVIVYVLYGKNQLNINSNVIDEKIGKKEVKEKKKFNIEESWGFVIGLLSSFGFLGSLVSGFMVNFKIRSLFVGLIIGIVIGIISLIIIYVVIESVKPKK